MRLVRGGRFTFVEWCVGLSLAFCLLVEIDYKLGGGFIAALVGVSP